NAATIWPAEPFDLGLLGRATGRLTLRSAHVSLTPRLAAKKVRAVLRLAPAELALEEIDGTLAGGRVAGALAFRRGDGALPAQLLSKAAGAGLAELIRGGPPPLSGRLTIDVDVEGTGRSPIAVIGALHGGGSFTVQDAHMLRVDPAAFEAVIRNVDQGLP